MVAGATASIARRRRSRDRHGGATGRGPTFVAGRDTTDAVRDFACDCSGANHGRQKGPLMQHFPSELVPGGEIDVLLPYVTDLEFEVDRLRRQGRFIEQQARETLKQL